MPKDSVGRRHRNRPQVYGPLPVPLNDPIYSPKPLIDPEFIGPPSPATMAQRVVKIREAKLDKTVLLAEAYGLDIEALRSKFYRSHADFWRQLAECLATDFVPGFRVVERKPGRPTGSVRIPGDIYDAVSALTADGATAIAEACRMLSKRKGPWKDEKPEALETRYHREKTRRQRLASLLKTGAISES